MRQLRIKVNQKTIDYIERLQYEIMARQDVIALLIERNSPEVLESDTFRAYSCQLSQLKAEYEMAKEQLEKRYVPEVLNGHQYRWHLDLRTNHLNVEVLCACGIEALLEVGYETA